MKFKTQQCYKLIKTLLQPENKGRLGFELWPRFADFARFFCVFALKTITGAINSAKKLKCSPAIALEAKTFSHQYWANQHRLLIDAVQQFGFPSVFITISQFEWTFPVPPWIDHLRQETGRGPTELAVPETIHIVHVLEQYIRRYLCGANMNRWKTHVVAKKSDRSISNVVNYFYRFEFQKHGTLHTHILVWLDDMTNLDIR